MVFSSVGIWMIAAAIVREAADQPIEGKRAVAQVVVARAREWKKPLSKVLTPSQFPWAAHRPFMPKAKNKIDQAVQKEALVLARQAANGARSKHLQKGTYLFFNTKPSGRKFKTEVPLISISAHYFY
jgi:spore germination cell wall hydrolase CwlJ-like protein